MNILRNIPLIEEVTAALSPTDSANQTETSQAASGDANAFESQLRALLSPSSGSEVNEEELFAAVVQERLLDTKGESVSEDFSTSFERHKRELTRGDGYVNVEEAANRALADMVAVGHVTQAEHDEIYDQSFMAAQLDGNLNALYDGRGGEGDATIATADLDSALLSARTAIEALQNGELPPNQLGASIPTTGEASTDELTTATDETITPNGNEIDGDEGFVFKPESEGDGKLVILLPPNYTRLVEDVLLKDQDDNIVERGRGTGVANGGREHFRFERPGEGYPDNLTVEVRLTSGEVKQYQIPNPGERYD